MSRLPVILCGSLLGGTLGWYAGGTASTKAGISVHGAEREKAVASVMTLSVAQLNVLEVKARIDAMLASTEPDGAALQLLMVRWVALDLEGAKVWMREHYDEYPAAREAGAQPLACFFGAWAAFDPASAMDGLLEMKGKLQSRPLESAMAAVVASLARADRRVMLSVLQKLEPGRASGSDPGGIADLLRQVAAGDPEGAKTMALQLKGGVGMAAIAGVAEVWARTDPQAALAWAEQNGASDPQNRAAEAVLTQWARQDPAAAGPFLLQKTPGQPDRFCVAAAAEAVACLANLNTGQAIAFAKDFIPPDQLKSGLTDFYYRLCVQNGDDPKGATLMCALVGSLPPESLKTASLLKGSLPSNEVVQTVWNHLQDEPDSAGRTFMLGQLGQKLVASNLESFLADVSKMPDEKLRDNILEQALTSDQTFTLHADEDWQARFQSLAAAIEGLPENLQLPAARKLARSVFSEDLEATASVIAKYPAIAREDNLIPAMARQFLDRTGPAAAQTWATSLPEAARASAYAGIASGWYEQDSLAASRWVNSLAPGPERDGAAASLSAAAFSDDPGAAFAWVSSVKDDVQRTGNTTRVVKNWARFDWQAASMAVQASPLPSDQKAVLQSLLSARH